MPAPPKHNGLIEEAKSNAPVRRQGEGYFNVSEYQPPSRQTQEVSQYRATKFEESQFKLMLGELKKIKKELVKSKAEEKEEPKRLQEDFSVIKNLEDP